MVVMLADCDKCIYLYTWIKLFGPGGTQNEKVAMLITHRRTTDVHLLIFWILKAKTRSVTVLESPSLIVSVFFAAVV